MKSESEASIGDRDIRRTAIFGNPKNRVEIAESHVEKGRWELLSSRSSSLKLKSII